MIATTIMEAGAVLKPAILKVVIRAAATQRAGRVRRRRFRAGRGDTERIGPQRRTRRVYARVFADGV
jgi:hypothetical protein